jgi:glycosyltransferase involved in cell wall biosynthesis
LRKLLVIPNDPLQRYVDKGEVKERYFNPENFFDEIHVLSLCDKDDALESAGIMSGSAGVSIHPIGRPGLLSWRTVRGRALELALALKPDVIRGYNPLFMGYLAVYCAQAAKAIGVVSVHDDYSLPRSLKIYGPRYLATARGAYQPTHHLLGFNRYMFARADHIICAYRFPLRYVNRWRKAGVSVIYNRVNLKKFYPSVINPEISGFRLRVLNVGRQFEGKNPEPLIRALAGMRDISLTLVGDGPFHNRLVDLAQRLGVSRRVRFLPRVEHHALPELYREHDVFAMAITQPGVCIPVLEAAASGLPVVINKPRWEDEPEVVGGLAEVVPLTAVGYLDAFNRLADDPGYRAERGLKLREHVGKFDGAAMEHAENRLYSQLLQSSNGGKG